MMDPERQVTKVPFDTNESFFVDGENRYLVKRLQGILDGVCPGEILILWNSIATMAPIQ
jgi:hypothetical protein